MTPSLPSVLNDLCRLTSLRCGDACVIEKLEGSMESQLRLLELGVAPGEEVVLRYLTPLGGPLEIELMNYRLAIRRSEANRIWVRRLL